MLMMKNVDNLASDEELTTEADLLSSFTPPQLEIRLRPKASKPLGSRITAASLKRSLSQIYPSLSVKGTSDDSNTNVNKPVTNCSSNARKEIEKLFDEDSQCLASSLRKNAHGRRRIVGTSTSPNSRELLLDSHVDDFQGEIFSSGSETCEDQMIKIRNDYDHSKVVDKKVTESDVM